MKKRMVGIAQSVGIFVLVFGVWGIISEWNWNVFCYDDNYTQWLPVIDDTYSAFFHTGKINYWNFYLMGGINILDTGIYSILNPFMFLGYILSHLFNVSNSITLCMYLIVSVAMLVFYYIFRKFEISCVESYCLIFCILACSSYYALGNWYYVVNNLLIGAFLVWYFLEIHNINRVNLFFAGVVLGFSIYLGNVQYTVMWYMAFAVISINMLFFSKEKKELIILFSNIVVAIVISLPQLFMNYRASQNTAFDGANADFFSFPLHLYNIIVHGILPDDFLNSITGVEFSEYYFSSHFYFVGIFLICFIVAWLNIKREVEEKNYILIAFLVCALFFVLWSLGKKGIVACILYKLPIVQSFRLLQKVWFVVVPLLIVPTLFVLTKIKKRNVLIGIGVLLAVVNINGITINGMNMYGQSDLASCESVDLENYKVLAIIKNQDESSSFLGDVQNPYIDEKISIRNYSAYYHIYTIGAYNLSYSSSQYEIVNSLMSNNTMWSEFAYANAKDASTFEINDSVVAQLNNSSVKYIVTNSDETISLFQNNCNNIEIEDIIDLGDGYKVLSLFNIPSIIRAKHSGEKLHFINNGNYLTIYSESSDIIEIQFPYSDKYKAYYYDGKKKVFCNVSRDSEGFIEIEDVPENQQIVLEYTDVFSKMAIIFSALAFVLICTSIFWVGHRIQSNDVVRQIR